MSDYDDPEYDVFDIDSPAIPEEVREFARRFIEKIRWVCIIDQEYWLLDANGEVVDICWF